MDNTTTTTEGQVPTYSAVIVIGSIAILVMLELIFRGSE